MFSALALMIFCLATAQDEKSQKKDFSKGYVGISIGAAFPGGDLTKDELNAKTGLNIGLINAGFRFTENFGLTLNWGASAFKDSDFDEVTYGVGYLAIGPMLSLPINDKFGFDFKPQYAFTSLIVDVDGEDFNFTGPGGILVSSTLNYSFAKHWGLALNLDYLSSKYNKLDNESIERDVKVSTFSTSLGIQYRF